MHEYIGRVCTVKLCKLKPWAPGARCWFWADDAKEVPCLVVGVARTVETNYALLLPDGAVADFMESLCNFPAPMV